MALHHPAVPFLFMSSENLEKLRIELTSHQSVLEPQIEGLNDYAQLNIQSSTLDAVNAASTALIRRRDLVSAAITALTALGEDNYPDMSSFDVAESVYADLEMNLRTINAAFSRFRSREEAATAEIVAGPLINK